MKQSNVNIKLFFIEPPEPLFQLGRFLITSGVGELIREERLDLKEVSIMLARHVSGDWGDLEWEDRRANEEALRDGARLFSAYDSLCGERLWVITDAMGEGDRRPSTTVLLAGEY